MNIDTLNANRLVAWRLLRTAAMLTCLSWSLCESVLAGPVDRPGFNGARQVGNQVIFHFTGVGGLGLL